MPEPSRHNTAKRIRDGSIVSSIKPNFDDRFVADFSTFFCLSCESEIVFVFICRTGRTISGSQLVQNK